jgi:hypothetical protein
MMRVRSMAEVGGYAAPLPCWVLCVQKLKIYGVDKIKNGKP